MKTAIFLNLLTHSSVANFQFPTLWDEDCNHMIVFDKHFVNVLSVPYTLG